MIVDIAGMKLATKIVNIGLPPGSVSSPYLFSLYVNDMCRSSDKLNFIHFADDEQCTWPVMTWLPCVVM